MRRIIAIAVVGTFAVGGPLLVRRRARAQAAAAATAPAPLPARNNVIGLVGIKLGFLRARLKEARARRDDAEIAEIQSRIRRYEARIDAIRGDGKGHVGGEPKWRSEGQGG